MISTCLGEHDVTAVGGAKGADGGDQDKGDDGGDDEGHMLEQN